MLVSFRCIFTSWEANFRKASFSDSFSHHLLRGRLTRRSAGLPLLELHKKPDSEACFSFGTALYHHVSASILTAGDQKH